MFNKLTIRLKIFKDESISSYIFRISKENGVSFLVFWNMIKISSKTHTKFGKINILDIAPLRHIDANAYKEITGCTSESLISNSFYKVLERIQVKRTRFIVGIFDYRFRYCPLCLREKAYNKLIWRIKNIKICNLHKVMLLDRCLCCNSTIEYEKLRELGKCPHCGNRLVFEIKNENFDQKFLNEQKYLYETWNTLLYGRYNKIKPKDIAYKILFVLNNKNNEFNRYNAAVSIKAKNKLATILKYAKGNIGLRRMLNLDTIINILYNNNMSMQEFLNLNVPNTFISSVNSKPLRKIEIASCIAPWCNNINGKGKLIKTGTSMETHVSGNSLLYYMFCPECGCAYAYDKLGNIQERTNYIESYYLLNKFWNKEISLKKLSIITGVTEERLKRRLAYFNSRGFFLKSNWAYKFDNRLLELFLEGLKKNMTTKEIMSWKCWGGYRNYLLYRYNKDVIYELNTRKINKRTKVDFNRLKIQKCLEKMYNENEKITLSSVGNALGVSLETIRAWGGNKSVSKYKMQQELLEMKNNKERLYKEIDNYLYAHNNIIIKSKELYEYLGVIRNILWRRYPDITADITDKIKDHNKKIKQMINIK
jgi:hypothetical protein